MILSSGFLLVKKNGEGMQKKYWQHTKNNTFILVIVVYIYCYVISD